MKEPMVLSNSLLELKRGFGGYIPHFNKSL